MISRLLRTMLAAVLCCTVTACGLLQIPKWAKRKPVPKAVPIRFPKGDAADAAKGKRKPIGTILLVNADAGFVLIDTHGSPLPEAGLALKCMRENVESGVLTVGRERRDSHVIADITTGTPHKGDQVFQ